MNKKISLLTLLGIAALPSLALADVSIQGMVDGAVQTALYIASGIVVILWIVTGVLFLTAQGEPGKLSTAKTALFASVAGTIIVIIASSAIPFVSSIFHI